MIDDVTVQIISGALLFVLGASVTAWRQRARPLVILQGFSKVLTRREKVEIPAELQELTTATAHTDYLVGPEAEVGEVSDAWDASRLTVFKYEDGLKRLDEVVERFHSATHPDEVREAVKHMLTHRGVHEAFDAALKRAYLKVPEVPEDATAGDRLPVAPTNERGGSYALVWRGETSLFSSGLDLRPWLRPRIEPFVEMLSHLHAPSLMESVEAVRPFMEEQVDLHKRVAELSEPLTKPAGRWAAKVLVANYGGNAMVLWPEATLRVRHKSSKSRYEIDSYVAVEYEDAPQVRDLEGVLVLAPGERRVLWVITSAMQSEIPNGALLGTLYDQGDAMGRISLKVSRRGALFGPGISSTNTPFVNSTELPGSG